MNPATALLILKVIDLLAAGTQLFGEDKERYDRLTGKIRVMVEENRGPTDEEFDELLDESDALTERLRAARDAKPD